MDAHACLRPGNADSRRGRGPWARRQSNATCVPLKPPSPCHPGLSLQLSLLGREKTRERKNKIKQKKEMSCSLRQVTGLRRLAKKPERVKKKRIPEKNRFFIAVLVNKSDLWQEVWRSFLFLLSTPSLPILHENKWEAMKGNEVGLNKVWRQRKSERRNNKGQSALSGPHKSNHIKLSQGLQ